MLKGDIPVWYKFLEKYGGPFLNLYYDCLLGAPDLLEEEKKDPLKRDWRILMSKRADAIAELEREVWIIEVAAEPGLRALGQVQAYRILWLRDPPIAKLEKMVIVGSAIDPVVLDAGSAIGVMIFSIPGIV